MQTKNKIFLLLMCISSIFAQAQTTLFDLNTIQDIEINFSQADWDYQLDTAKIGADGYLMATWVKINGVQFDSVGVKYKGNSSYNATYAKNPMHLALDKFKAQNYQGVKDIKLGNGYADPAMIREVLSYSILGNYMDCSRSNFAKLTINGNYIGLYANDESIDKAWVSEHLASSNHTFIKCNPTINPGPNTKSNLKFIPAADSSGYFNYYEIKSSTGWNDLVHLCDSVTNNSSSMAENVDIDKLIWMLAFDNVLVNLDSYMGAFCQNYYLYKDNTGRYSPIIWDLNMSFGGFPYVGSGTGSLGSLTIANMQQLSPTIHIIDVNWPLIKGMLANPMYKRMYFAHIRTIVNEVFANGNYSAQAAQMQTLINAAVIADTNKFFSDAAFQNGMTANNAVGTYNVPGISVLMAARVNYLQGLADYSAVAPSITAVGVVGAPLLGAQAAVQATITNNTVAYLMTRPDKNNKFTRFQMYDDGLHNDGAAADGIFGANFLLNNPTMQYYIYAENTNAGSFSPARAEHEFYSVTATITTINAQDITINEIMASNTATVTDESGLYSDWIELYNNTNTTILMDNLYISDSYTSPLKYAIPTGTNLAPHSYLTLWADDNAAATTAAHLHAAFKLSGSGERVILSYANGVVIDSTSFGAQTTDISWARCTNGTGAFSAFLPTFGLENTCLVATNNATIPATKLQIFPNPASQSLNIITPETLSTICIYTAIGTKMMEITATANTTTIDITALPQGSYYLSSINMKGQRGYASFVKY
jgi:CotH kinase protein/Lamin Tail Domain/Secretion system C-terminal sorting domain